MDTELWKAILGFLGYDVSSHGQVRSQKRGKTQILKPGPGGSRGQYRAVNLQQGGKGYHRRIPALVALAFLGPRPDGLEVCHNDSNPTNDRLDNLRYDTHKANMRDASCQGRLQRPSGEASPLSIYTDESAKQLREEFASGMSTSDLAREYNVPRVSISSIVYGRSYPDAGGPIAKSPRLSTDEIEELRHKRADGASLKELAKEYGLSVSGVSRVALGNRRTKVGGPIQLVPWQPT